MIEKIKEIIEDITGEKVDENTDLIEEGFLDSFDIVSLVLELNDAFGIKIEVAELLPENFSNINDIEKVDENTDLIEEGFLDSFDIVSLVLELNDAFGIKIEVAELLPENFSNINDIEKLVKSLQ